MRNGGMKVPALVADMARQVEVATSEVGGTLGLYLDTHDFECYPYVVKQAVREIRRRHPDWDVEEAPSRDGEYGYSVLIVRTPTAEDWQVLDRRLTAEFEASQAEWRASHGR